MGDPVWTAAALTAAIAVDLALGDPRSRGHPVTWMGTFLARGQRHLCRGHRRRWWRAVPFWSPRRVRWRAVAGTLVAVGSQRAGWPGVIFEGIALKLSFSLRDLASAAIESAAENPTDAFIAPLAFYVAFGLAGAYIYRVVNTAEAMLGYRAGDLEYFGKIAARTDDTLNFLPAWIGGLLIATCAALGGANAPAAWRTRCSRSTGGRPAPTRAGRWPPWPERSALRSRNREVTGSGEGGYRAASDVVRSVRLTVLSALVGAAAMLVGLLAWS